MKTLQKPISPSGGDASPSSPEVSPANLFPMQVGGGGQKDERYLWTEMFRAIDEIRPAWVVGENVAGITTMVEGGILADLGCEAALFSADDELHRYELEQTFTIERICRDLERIGYSVQPMLIPAAAVGAPHRRDRIFIIAHTDGTGRKEPQQPGRGTDSPETGTRIHDRTERPGRDGTAAHADSHGHTAQETGAGVEGCGRGNDAIQDEWGIKAERNDGFPRFRGPASDTDLQRCDERLNPCKPRKEERLHYETHRHWRDSERMESGRRWAGFPTVAPVHRGNDGLPFSLDDLTIPPSRWRNESLKAYGNAIVPQVMYEIFLAIQEYEYLH